MQPFTVSFFFSNGRAEEMGIGVMTPFSRWWRGWWFGRR